MVALEPKSLLVDPDQQVSQNQIRARDEAVTDPNPALRAGA